MTRRQLLHVAVKVKERIYILRLKEALTNY